MKKKLIALLLCLALFATLVACAGKTTTEPTQNSQPAQDSTTTTDETTPDNTTDEQPQENTDAASYEQIDFHNDKVWGDVGPDGSVPGGLDDVMLTDEEIQQVKDGNFRVAICYHQLDNQVNQSKLQATLDVFKELNIEVVCTTDAQSDANKEVNDLETALALKPDLLLSMPYDVEVTKAAYQQYMDAGIPVVFMENASKDFVAGKDYVCVTNSDSYGNGKYAAMLLADAIGYSGTVAMVYYDADFFTTNERDRGFRDQMANYPNIEIVAETGFTSIDVVGTVADGLFAQYPDVDGVYASWDIPAEDVITSARSIGRTDLKVTGVDLGDNSAYMIANQDMYVGTACPKAVETGKIEAYVCAAKLIGKEVPTYLCSSSQPVCYDNVLEAYEICFQIEAPDAVKQAWESHQ